MALLAFAVPWQGARSQQPAEPVDPTPINGETYYFINQLSALQIDLNSGSTKAGDILLQEPTSFTSLSQRWVVTKLQDKNWKISNLMNGLCLDSISTGSATSTLQNPCLTNTGSQEWSFTYQSNGYNVIVNAASGKALDVAGSSITAGAALNQTSLSATPAQSQLWLFRPVFFRGNDNAILEKQEALRVAGGYPWWQDAGQVGDVLQILKNHGFNMVRIRPTSAPPYQTYTLGSSAATPGTCSANGCYAETDSASLDLAKRAKQLGMSVELSLFFDGGSSVASPGAWSGYTVAQTQTAIYNYTKAEVESYRSAGAMPDMVSVGNEVDTGFLGSLGGSPSGAANSTAFQNFSAYETSGMQAVTDAASDPALGAAIPPPIRCIHITPAWDLTSFFSEVNTDKVPYDAVCQSYYPIFHGPLTSAQAAASNPNNKPVEQTALTSAANSIAKPIFLIEIGEHYENGYQSNDPWYAATPVGQRQFVLDVESVLKGLPNNLGMGFEYWDGEGTNIPNQSGFTAGDGKPDATYVWNGLTLFDNADTGGATAVSAATYNAVLPAASAVGGTLDSTLAYKFVNAGDGSILETAASLTTSGASLDTGVDTGVTTLNQQWRITSNNDGYFQIANLNPATPANVLDTQGATAVGSSVTQVAAASGTASQEWDVITAGNGYFTILNKASSLLLSAVSSGSGDAIQQQAPSASNADWITPAGKNQMWQIVPVHISIAPSVVALPATTTKLTSSATSVMLGTSLTFTATVTGTTGVPQPTGMVTFMNGTAALGNGTLGSGVATYVTSTLAVGTYSITATYPGDGSNGSSVSTALSIVVSPPPDFAISLSPSSATITAGSSTTSIVSITPSGGFSAATSLKCSGLPAYTSCTFLPASVTPTTAAATATMTISTDVATAALTGMPSTFEAARRTQRGSLKMAAALAMLLIPCLIWQKRRSTRLGTLAAACLAIGWSVLSGCGSGSSTQQSSPPPTTPSGQSTVTVTATSGSLVHTASFQLTIP